MDAVSMLRGMSGNISLSRTQAAIGFLVSSCVVGWQAYQGTLSEVVFGLYFGFCTAGYLGAKKLSGDKDIKEQQIDAGMNPGEKP